MSENITVARTRLPPSAKPDCCRSCATSRRREAAHQLLLLVAQPLLLEARADARLQQHRIDRLVQVVLGAELDAAHDVVDAFERRGDDDRQVAQLQVGHQLLEHLEAVHLRHLHVEQHAGRSGSRRSISSATRPFSADATLWPCSSRLRVEQQPVDLVVVDDQQARAVPRSRIAQLRQRRRPRARIRRRAHRARCAVAAPRPRPPVAPARAPARRACSAPNVLLFDLSECAARRKRSASSRGERAAQVGEHRRRLVEERVDELARRTRRRRCPAARRRSARSIVGSRHVRLLACRHLVQRLDQPLDADRLGEVVVHAGGEAHLAVALHRVGGHRDDARALAGCQRAVMRRAASSPSISGICTSISTTS